MFKKFFTKTNEEKEEIVEVKEKTKFDNLVEESEKYMKEIYGYELTDEEMLQLSDLLLRIKYCDKYSDIVNSKVKSFITSLTCDACLVRCNIAKERSKKVLEQMDSKK